MSDVFVGGRGRDKAVLLLAAAEDLELPSRVVRTQTGGYLVPEEVAEAAGLTEESDSGVPADSAKKAEWVEFAVAEGGDRDEVSALTKAEIISQYKPEDEE